MSERKVVMKKTISLAHKYRCKSGMAWLASQVNSKYFCERKVFNLSSF
jgi:hypothetical protein